MAGRRRKRPRSAWQRQRYPRACLDPSGRTLPHRSRLRGGRRRRRRRLLHRQSQRDNNGCPARTAQCFRCGHWLPKGLRHQLCNRRSNRHRHGRRRPRRRWLLIFTQTAMVCQRSRPARGRHWPTSANRHPHGPAVRSRRTGSPHRRNPVFPLLPRSLCNRGRVACTLRRAARDEVFHPHGRRAIRSERLLGPQRARPGHIPRHRFRSLLDLGQA